jgi:molybdopterin-biosynthesis enzyme MoeA-like protein
MHHLAGVLSAHAIDLKEVRIVSDDPASITSAVSAMSDVYTYVFTSGGIGPTHDDITADCVAAAFDDHIDVRPDARKLLADYYAQNGRDLNAARLRMARIPDSATLIENPVSIAPGFILKNVHVMAGVPSVFKAMVQSILPTLTGGAPLISETHRCMRGEGDIAAPLGQIASEFTNLSIGSYPFQQDGLYGTNIVVRGTDPAEIKQALEKIADAEANLG